MTRTQFLVLHNCHQQQSALTPHSPINCHSPLLLVNPFVLPFPGISTRRLTSLRVHYFCFCFLPLHCTFPLVSTGCLQSPLSLPAVSCVSTSCLQSPVSLPAVSGLPCLYQQSPVSLPAVSSLLCLYRLSPVSPVSHPPRLVHPNFPKSTSSCFLH